MEWKKMERKYGREGKTRLVDVVSNSSVKKNQYLSKRKQNE